MRIIYIENRGKNTVQIYLRQVSALEFDKFY